MSTGADPGAALPPPQDVVELALALSRGEGCAVLVEEVSQTEVRFANSTTTTNGVRRGRRVAVVSFRLGGRAGPGGADPGAGTRTVGGAPTAVGVASGSGDVDVEALVRRAEAEAAAVEPADDAFPLVDPSAVPAPGRFDDPPGLTAPGVLGDVLGDLAGAFRRARATDVVLSGFATHGVETTYLGTSTGVRARHAQPAGSMELVGRSTDGSRSAWTGAATATFADVEVAAFEERVHRRLDWARHRVELPAGRYEVLLPPDATADLMVPLSQELSGRAAEEGRSPFSAPGGGTRLGRRLCDLPFELRGDPAAPGLESAPFLATAASGPDVSVFDNGLPVPATAWIEAGVLRRLRYHRAGAARAGTAPTPPVGNLVLSLPASGGGAGPSLEDMIGTTERALLLTCLWYIREVDPVTLLLTGLTRDGVYLVEGGEIVGAVNNFRFNESPLDVLARTAEAGATVRALSREWGEWMPRTAMPPLRVADFNMSSVSPAS
ncbi:MAG TPA: metallopeptidase TldD-related protein [Acidimicrobiales bacterium]|nr:metallopeptidase TldD-related protein [Acidimicrobiales bacterium]